MIRVVIDLGRGCGRAAAAWASRPILTLLPILMMALGALLPACVHTADLHPSFACGEADFLTAAVDASHSTPLVRAELERGTPQLRRCYEADLARDATAKGRVRIVWTVGSNGKVNRACVAQDETTYVSDALHACMLSQVRSWRFSPTTTTVATPLSHVFVFEPLKPTTPLTPAP